MNFLSLFSDKRPLITGLASWGLNFIEKFLICLIAGDKRCSLNKLKKTLNKKDVSMANANEVKEITGFSIGGVSPIGHLNKLDIIIDKSLSRFEYIYGAAGHPDCVFKINYVDLINLTNGLEKEIIEWESPKLSMYYH